MRKTISLLSLLAAVVIVMGCTGEGAPLGPVNPGNTVNANMISDEISIVYEVISPDYYTEVKIQNDGSMALMTNIGLNQIFDSRQADASKINDIKVIAKPSDFWVLNDSYVDWDVNNGTSYIINMALGNRTNVVLCYETCPDSTLQLRQAIVDAWGEEL